jgi:hypothetical protein
VIPNPPVADLTVLSPRELLEVVETLATDRATWLARVEHHPERRWYARVRANAAYDAWLIGWNTAQGVDLHDHGGSSGALHVLDGSLVEVSAAAPESPLRTGTRLIAGSTRAFGPTLVHAVTNRAAVPATSLHVYSPPLQSMDLYSESSAAGLARVGTERGADW